MSFCKGRRRPALGSWGAARAGIGWVRPGLSALWRARRRISGFRRAATGRTWRIWRLGLGILQGSRSRPRCGSSAYFSSPCSECCSAKSSRSGRSAGAGGPPTCRCWPFRSYFSATSWPARRRIGPLICCLWSSVLLCRWSPGPVGPGSACLPWASFWSWIFGKDALSGSPTSHDCFWDLPTSAGPCPRYGSHWTSAGSFIGCWPASLPGFWRCWHWVTF